jgi:hypothetical protein
MAFSAEAWADDVHPDVAAGAAGWFTGDGGYTLELALKR